MNDTDATPLGERQAGERPTDPAARTGGRRAPARVEIFDPVMCCPTGLCGPAPDQKLLDVHEMVRVLEREGVAVARYQMGSQPTAFLVNPEVSRLLMEHRLKALPITLVDGRVLRVGAYPSLDEVRAALAAPAAEREGGE